MGWEAAWLRSVVWRSNKNLVWCNNASTIHELLGRLISHPSSPALCLLSRLPRQSSKPCHAARHVHQKQQTLHQTPGLLRPCSRADGPLHLSFLLEPK